MSLGGMRPASSAAATFRHVLNAVLNDGAAESCSRLICDSATESPWQSKQNCLKSAPAAAENAASSAPTTSAGTTQQTSTAVVATRQAQWVRRGRMSRRTQRRQVGFRSRKYGAARGERPACLRRIAAAGRHFASSPRERAVAIRHQADHGLGLTAASCCSGESENSLGR